MSDRKVLVVASQASPATSWNHASPGILAWTLGGIAIAFTSVEIWLSGQNGTAAPASIANLTLLLVAGVGALIASRQPRDATGWILLGIGLIGGLGGLLWDYGYRAIVFPEPWLPLGPLAFWVGSWIWVPAVGAGLPALLVRLPDGRVHAPWQPIDGLVVVGSLAVLISMAVSPGPLDATLKLPNPYALTGADSWLVALRWTGYGLLTVAFVGSVTSLVMRFRDATGDEREQMKWITGAAAIVTAALLYGIGRQVFAHENLFAALTLFFVATLALPIGIGIAVLKYRLYDIDLVINRTLVYGGLTAMLAGLYTFVVGLTQRLVAFSGQRSDIVILLTAFVGAATFTPVKNWLQKTVDTRFAVHDPASVVDSLRQQIEVIVNVLDAQRIARRLVEDSASTYQAKYVALSLGRDQQAVPLYTYGDASANFALKIVLHCQGEERGVLSLGPRRGGAVYAKRDETALQLCADAVAEAINLWEGALRLKVDGPGASAR
jgi:hypothetical protein